ncbi:MAG: sensor histidine kinase [Acetobacteraceae bacterium]
MIGRGAPASLAGILTRRMVLGALVVAVGLTVVTFAKYLLETNYLRRETLENQGHAVAAALAEGRNPSGIGAFRRFPHNYGFRAFDHRLAYHRHLIAAANPGLLPPIPTDASGQLAALEEKFEVFADPAGSARRLWQLTEREDIGPHHYWIQTAMLGDPDWQWRSVLRGEMMDHVIIPLLTLVPVLTLVMLLTTRTALRPLGLVAARAGAMSTAAAHGQTLAPLPADGLPRELASVVAALNAMLARLQRSMSIQKQFTADVAHELRTPIAVLLLSAAELPEGPTRVRMQSELAGLGQLVQELLRFAQAEDALAEARQDVDLEAVARKVCEEMAPDAVRRGLMIEFETVSPAPVIAGNAALVEIALRNLVENGLKYSPPGGTVTVRLAAGGQFRVEDRGPGVPEALRGKVFERFWRAEPGTGGGAGVGLALVRRVAQLHGGEARLEDRSGGGTSAVLALGGG